MGRARRQSSRTGRRRRSGSGTRALRHAYFAQAFESAGRYGITFDEMLLHLWKSRNAHGPIPLRGVRCIDDLVHAVACANGLALAWSDLVERYEAVLVRRATEQIGEEQSILHVRRLFLNLRGTDGAGLREYVGERPLRAWLTDRVLGQVLRRPSVWQPGRRTAVAQRPTRWQPSLPGTAEAPSCLPFGEGHGGR